MSAWLKHKIYYGTSEIYEGRRRLLLSLNRWRRRGSLLLMDTILTMVYPVLSWKKPALPSYKISVSNEIIVSNTAGRNRRNDPASCSPKKTFLLVEKYHRVLKLHTGELKFSSLWHVYNAG